MRPQIGIEELRENLDSVIQRVSGGESIEVTDDGRPVALLSPHRVERMASPAEPGPVPPERPLGKPLRRFPITGAMTASAAIDEDRGRQ